MGMGAKEDAYLWQWATCINVIFFKCIVKQGAAFSLFF